MNMALIGTVNTGDLIGLAGLAISIVGFVVTLSQIHRTRRAAEAARVATVETSDVLSRAQMLASIERLGNIDRELMWAADNDDPKSLLHQTKTWATTASELAGLFEARGETGLVEALCDSARTADEVRQEFLDSRPPVSIVSSPLRYQAGGLVRDLAQLASRERSTVSEQR